MSKTNKDTYSYYKKSYRANTRYRTKIGNNDYADMLSKAEFESYKATGLETKEIVYNQFHYYNRSTVKKLQESLKQEGFNISIKNIQARNYSADVYNKISKIYYDLKATMSSKEAAALISYTYYGS